MNTLGVVRKNTYFDSVTLMGISKKLGDLPGVVAASVSMGTDMNKEVLVSGGFSLDAVGDASANDLMIACQYEGEVSEEELLAQIEEALTPPKHDDAEQEAPRTLTTGAARNDANIAIISVPGAYAAAEARKALTQGLHVMMFSDNVSYEDEVALKQLAHEKGLLMMGPDCGTAIIQGVPLCFANKVARGDIGIVGASGTGSQELSVLLDQAGLGISQLIGTGGRDLSAEVGGIMFLDAFDMLDRDEATKRILLVSKPPHPSVLPKIQERIENASKSVVACFLGSAGLEDAGTALYVSTLEDAIGAMVALENAEATFVGGEPLKLEGDYTGKYVRGLFCGGTLMEEAKQIFASEVGSDEVYSNSAKGGALPLNDVRVSQGHTFLDMGDDAFTQGKPHPMIDPEVRNGRIVAEAADPDTQMILLDFVLGYGAHPDPVGAALPAIKAAKEKASSEGRNLSFVAYVLGTERDPQGKADQRKRLEDEGVVVCDSNAQAAKTVAAFVKGGE